MCVVISSCVLVVVVVYSNVESKPESGKSRHNLKKVSRMGEKRTEQYFITVELVLKIVAIALRTFIVCNTH